MNRPGKIDSVVRGDEPQNIRRGKGKRVPHVRGDEPSGSYERYCRAAFPEKSVPHVRGDEPRTWDRRQDRLTLVFPTCVGMNRIRGKLAPGLRDLSVPHVRGDEPAKKRAEGLVQRQKCSPRAWG